MPEMRDVARCLGKLVAQEEMMEYKAKATMKYHATVGFDDCKGCGTHLAYTPNIGDEAECPNCHAVHEIIAGGLLKLKDE
jgi:hypothetical protein